jgi:hypothetical protein
MAEGMAHNFLMHGAHVVVVERSPTVSPPPLELSYEADLKEVR